MAQKPEERSLEASTEASLLQLAKQGESGAVAELLERYKPLLRRAVSSCGTKIVQWDDLEQEGFLGLLTAIQTFEPQRAEAKFSTYAYTCIRNRVLSSMRRIRRQDEQNDLSSSLENESSENELDPALLVQEKEEKDRLFSLLKEELSELEYSVLQLRLQDFSYEEIGARLAVSAKVVDNALQRVRSKLVSRLR